MSADFPAGTGAGLDVVIFFLVHPKLDEFADRSSRVRPVGDVLPRLGSVRQLEYGKGFLLSMIRQTSTIRGHSKESESEIRAPREAPPAKFFQFAYLSACM